MFKPGVSGNPKGRPKGTTIFSLESFRKAIETVEKKKKKSLYVHAIERAFESDRVLAVILNKILPDIQIKHDDSDYEDSEIDFVGVPQNGEGVDRFKEYLN